MLSFTAFSDGPNKVYEVDTFLLLGMHVTAAENIICQTEFSRPKQFDHRAKTIRAYKVSIIKGILKG